VIAMVVVVSGKESLITGYISLVVKNKEGKELRRAVQPMRSLLRNFIVMLETMFKGMDTLWNKYTPSDAIDVNGNKFKLSFPTSGGRYGIPLGWRIDAEAGEKLKERGEPTDWGIMVGSSDDPNTINFWSLSQPYPHGSGSGYMNYLDTIVKEPYFDGSNVCIEIKRIIVNEANVSQTVREIGIIAREFYTWKRFLIARDVLDSPIDVPPKGMLEVTIVIQGILAPYNVFYVDDYCVGYDSSKVGKFE